MMRSRRWRLAAGLVAVCASVPLLGAVLSSPAQAHRTVARAVLVDAAGVRVGHVTFTGSGHHADRVEVDLRLPPGAPGLDTFHGLHVHTTGSCVAPAYTSAGGHWTLAPATHGSHTGDLSSVLVAPDGTASAEFETARFDVNQLFDADGSAIVLHAGPDNFGNVPLGGGKYEDPNNWYNAPTGTANTGDAGSRYACGVVTRR
jgi:superoxide dismutase, Cu-Zn family